MKAGQFPQIMIGGTYVQAYETQKALKKAFESMTESEERDEIMGLYVHIGYAMDDFIKSNAELYGKPRSLVYEIMKDS